MKTIQTETYKIEETAIFLGISRSKAYEQERSCKRNLGFI